MQSINEIYRGMYNNYNKTMEINSSECHKTIKQLTLYGLYAFNDP